jgi:predicted transcriptional regulator
LVSLQKRTEEGMKMPCILPDGSITETAKNVLAVARTEKSVEEIAKGSSLPLFRVRSSIRELIDAEFIAEKNGKYLTTEKGKEKI